MTILRAARPNGSDGPAREAARATIILVADDARPDAAVLAEATQRLRPAATLRRAANVDEALCLMATQRIDIALVHLGRPGADGIELAALMRRTRPDASIGVVSSELAGDAWFRAQDLGVTFIPKPITSDALEAFLARAELRLDR